MYNYNINYMEDVMNAKKAMVIIEGLVVAALVIWRLFLK